MNNWACLCMYSSCMLSVFCMYSARILTYSTGKKELRILNVS